MISSPLRTTSSTGTMQSAPTGMGAPVIISKHERVLSGRQAVARPAGALPLIRETAPLREIGGPQRESIHHHPVKGRRIPVGADLLPQHPTGRIFYSGRARWPARWCASAANQMLRETGSFWERLNRENARMGRRWQHRLKHRSFRCGHGCLSTIDPSV
nr:hypothetical protein [Nannocystis sp.]